MKIGKVKFIYSEKAIKFLRNLPLTFDYSTYGQKLGEDFAKFCGLLRIYELYIIETKIHCFNLTSSRCHISGQAMKLMIVLTFCLGFVACIPDPRDQVIISYGSGNFLLPTTWIGSPDLPYFFQSDPAAPEEPSASNKITPEMAEKLNELFHTGSNYLERFVNFLGSIFTEQSSAEEEEPFKPKKVFQLNIYHICAPL